MQGAMQLHITSLLCLIIYRMASGSVTVKYKFYSFSNNNHRDINGDSCDFGLAHHCDHTLLFCFDNYSGGSSTDSCPLARFATGEFEDQDSIRFGDNWRDPSNALVYNPVTINMDQWNGIKLKVRVIDDDSGHSNHDLVDTYDTTYYGDAYEWDTDIDDTYITMSYEGMRTASSPTSLIVHISVKCDRDYYGLQCDAHCPNPNEPYVEAINNCQGDIPREDPFVGPEEERPVVGGATMHDEKNVTGLIIGLIGGIFFAILVVIIAIAMVYRHKRNQKMENAETAGQFDNPVYAERRVDNTDAQNALNNRNATPNAYGSNATRAYPNLERNSTRNDNVYAISDQGAVGGDPIYDNPVAKGHDLFYDNVSMPKKV